MPLAPGWPPAAANCASGPRRRPQSRRNKGQVPTPKCHVGELVGGWQPLRRSLVGPPMINHVLHQRMACRGMAVAVCFGPGTRVSGGPQGGAPRRRFHGGGLPGRRRGWPTVPQEGAHPVCLEAQQTAKSSIFLPFFWNSKQEPRRQFSVLSFLPWTQLDPTSFQRAVGDTPRCPAGVQGPHI